MAQVRRVRRIIRKIDAWTVFKVAAIFWMVVALALVLGLVMTWSVIQAAEIPQRLTDFLIEITLLEQGAQPFSDTETYLRAAVFGSLAFGVLAIGLTTLAAVMYNLISDVVGGVELILLEEVLPAPVQQQTRYVPTPTPPPANGTSVDQPTEETPVSSSH